MVSSNIVYANCPPPKLLTGYYWVDTDGAGIWEPAYYQQNVNGSVGCWYLGDYSGYETAISWDIDTRRIVRGS